MKKRRRPSGMRRRSKISARYNVPKDTKFEYKNLAILQKFVNDRGKIVPRRLTGLNAKKQRELTTAVKRARFLALLPTGGVK